jgi:hypothetical protein
MEVGMAFWTREGLEGFEKRFDKRNQARCDSGNDLFGAP